MESRFIMMWILQEEARPKRLYRARFIDVMILPDGRFKNQIIGAFLVWASRVKGFDVANKFKNDQSRNKRFELLVHTSLIPDIYEKEVANERKKQKVKVDTNSSKAAQAQQPKNLLKKIWKQQELKDSSERL